MLRIVTLAISFGVSAPLFFTPAAAAEKIPQVTTLVITEENIQRVLKYPAVVAPVIEGKLISEISGSVTRIIKNIGQKVKKNDVVFYVKNTQAALNFNEFAVRSPVTGVVSVLEVTVGKSLVVGQSAGEVVDLSQFRWLVEVPAKDLQKINLNLEAQFESQGKTMRAKVVAISPVARAATGTSLVELAPLEKSLKLVFGTVGKATIMLPPEKLIAIPPDSLVKLNLKKFVQKLDAEDRIHLFEVQTGDLIQGRQLILSGLAPKDEIVVKSSDFLKDGDKIARAPKENSQPR
ncbi:MAG: HlyD family efflux transporter periplasmic adaptor subunit [Pseudomonadota bacterium]|nr:HlyD family efflux transporter periplasmic adaptor subunit [Pseudomonadota bacterium]